MRYRIAFDVARALKYLHSVTPALVHRDVRSPNVLLTTTDLNDVVRVQRDVKVSSDSEAILQDIPVLAKLSDFGLARMNTGSAEYVLTCCCIWLLCADWPVSRNTNPFWQAPEVLSGREYTTKSDVYSFGVLLWEIASRIAPFTCVPEIKSKFQLTEFIQKGSRAPVPQGTPAAFGTLLQECWLQSVRNPRNHNIFIQLNWSLPLLLLLHRQSVTLLTAFSLQHVQSSHTL